MELPREVADWLVACGALLHPETGPSRSTRNVTSSADVSTFVHLDDDAAARFETGIGTAALVRVLLQEKGLPEANLDGLRTASSPVAKLFNWNKLSPALAALGVPLDSETKSLILAGDVDAVGDILSVLHQMHGDVYADRIVSAQTLEETKENERGGTDGDLERAERRSGGADTGKELGKEYADTRGGPLDESRNERGESNANGRKGEVYGGQETEDYVINQLHNQSSRKPAQNGRSRKRDEEEDEEGESDAHGGEGNEYLEGKSTPPEERIDWSRLASTSGRPSSRLSDIEPRQERAAGGENTAKQREGASNEPESGAGAGGMEVLARLASDSFAVSLLDAATRLAGGDFAEWIVRGGTENEKVLVWLEKVAESAGVIAAAAVAEPSDLTQVLSVVSTGMGFGSADVIFATCQALAGLARALPEDTCTDWFLSEAGPLQGLTDCWLTHRSSRSAGGLAELSSSFCGGMMRALFQDKLHEVLPEAAVYMDVTEAILGPLGKNHTSRKALAAAGVPGDLTAFALRHLGNGQEEGVKLAAMSLVTAVWARFPSQVEKDEDRCRLAISTLKRACRDASPTLQLAAHGALFRLLDGFIAAGSAFAPRVYKALLFSFFEHFSRPDLHASVVSNLSHVLTRHPTVPVGPMLEPLARHVALHGFSPLDTDFFLVLARHRHVDAKQAAQLVSMLGHIVLHSPRYAPDVLPALTGVLSRFPEPGPAAEALALFCKEGFEALVGFLLRPQDSPTHPPVTEVLPPVLIQIARTGYPHLIACLQERAAAARADFCARARSAAAHPVLEKLVAALEASQAGPSANPPANPTVLKPQTGGFVVNEGARKNVPSWGPGRLLLKMADEATEESPAETPRTERVNKPNRTDGVNRHLKAPGSLARGEEPKQAPQAKRGVLPELRKSGARSPLESSKAQGDVSTTLGHRSKQPPGQPLSPKPLPGALSPKPATWQKERTVGDVSATSPGLGSSLAKRNLLDPASPNHSVNDNPGTLAPLKDSLSRPGQSPVTKKFVFGRTIIVKSDDVDDRGFWASGESNAASPVHPPGWWAERRKIEIEKIKKARAEKAAQEQEEHDKQLAEEIRLKALLRRKRMMERRNRDPAEGHEGDTSADGATSSRRAGRTRARLKPLESGSEAPGRRRSKTERNRNSRERKSRAKRDEVDQVLDDIIGVVSAESEVEERGLRARARAERKQSRFVQAQSSTEVRGRDRRTPREERNGGSGTERDEMKRKEDRSRRERSRAVESPASRHKDTSSSPRRGREDSSASPDRHRKGPVDSPGRGADRNRNPNPNHTHNLPNLTSPGSVPRFMSPLGKPPNPPNPGSAAASPKPRPPKPQNHQGGTPTATKLAEKALRLPRLVAPSGTSTPRSMGGGSEAGTATPGGGPQAEHPAAKALRIRREKQRLAEEAAKKQAEEEERQRRKRFEAHAVRLRDEAKRYQEQKAAREKAKLDAERKAREDKVRQEKEATERERKRREAEKDKVRAFRDAEREKEARRKEEEARKLHEEEHKRKEALKKYLEKRGTLGKDSSMAGTRSPSMASQKPGGYSPFNTVGRERDERGPRAKWERLPPRRVSGTGKAVDDTLSRLINDILY
ncbi:hypothetical protein KFL_001670130 [Klebsormidium nitens]|uniref:Uncharacterized protein n=1 Tax=Klebsormidium nitens TaxID=105231 RepID=A0A1Y1I1R3_KLENI|nr:hypothetical protein KFL_001670130 [Klebsormidium nitens]|eukprot:GAQ83902.1 hypothetical protein KFL_001670130 [Klebsormidium nitens]